MTSPIQFHPIHGEHIKLSKGNTIAKRVDSFCKGICFSHRPINVRERIHVRLLSKSVQWTGFLRLGMTTCDPQTHRSSEALPRHACPDLTCRPGYWAKCVPENCFDSSSKLTYFYVDENGELFLNTPNGDITLLTGIAVQDPLWALLDIYGNCISIELVEDPNMRQYALNERLRAPHSTVQTNFFRDLRSDLRPVPFLPVHSASISFFNSSQTSQPEKSIVLYDSKKFINGLVYFSESLRIETGLAIEVLRVTTSSDSRSRTVTQASSSTSSSHLQLGLTNCDIQALYQQQNSIPLTIDAINKRSELWIIQDFPLANKNTIDNNDEFLFVFTNDGILHFSHNNSSYQAFLHLDPTLNYYPFLIFQGDILALRSIGYLKSLDKCRGLQRPISPPKEPLAAVSSKNSEETESKSKARLDCTICLDQERDCVLIPCGHICLCYQCAKRVQEYSDRQCPICRSPIEMITKVYLS